MSARGSVEVRVEVRPRWPFRLSRRTGLDGVAQVRGGVLHRLLHAGEDPVSIRVAQIGPDRVLFGARAARREVAEWGIERMRLALGIDQDLRPFYERFRFDPLIGPSVRANPGLRVSARPDPFEALVWAICEQLIEYERAALIERRLTARLGRRCPETGLRDSPTAAVLAGQAPALLASLDLSPARALTLVRAAREVASGRVDLLAADHERGLAAPAPDRRDRQLDDPDARPDRPGAPGPAPGRGPGLHQAGRPAGERRSALARHRSGGGGVLRPVRPLERTGRAARPALGGTGRAGALRLAA